MLRITQLKLKYEHSDREFLEAILSLLKVKETEMICYEIVKKSLDARDKSRILFVYTVDVLLKQEEKRKKQIKSKQVSFVEKNSYALQEPRQIKGRIRPIIVGSGPAGLFCAYHLAKAGLSPLLLERGSSVEQRTKKVEVFWQSGVLDPDSNVQFGEGGAGTFSDGKLNTMVNDTNGRIRTIFETLVAYGAPKEILYLAKPHIGTDLLREVVRRIRTAIQEYGGEVRFLSKVTDIQIEKDRVKGVFVNETEFLPCEILVLAPGHSARDTFSMLEKKGVSMQQKAFAVGVRVEHPQELIGISQYGNHYKKLPVADYKLTHQCTNGRGVYTFCMCPGGYVVNASSEPGRLVVNGMSNQDRAGKNANSAVVVTLKTEDFANVISKEKQKEIPQALYGVELQRQMEEQAFLAGQGKIPIQLLSDFVEGKKSTSLGKVLPDMKGAFSLADLGSCFPNFVRNSILEGMKAFDRKIKGFFAEDIPLSGVESRTSSPVRLLRDENLESNIKGLYPCGEGAGYAGGITSAAVDGLKVFEQIYKICAEMRGKE